jgi:hypothetical protein
MNRVFFTLLTVLLTGLLVSGTVHAQERFTFGVVNNTFTDTEHETRLIKALTETDIADFPFVVINGIKSSGESCSDGLYQQRQTLLNMSETAVILSLTGADWTHCNNKHGASIATDRLSHIRELFFAAPNSLGQYTIPVFQQSALPKFRSFAENMRRESHGILFATINLPTPNNHWLSDGGRNSEFEDRSIANKDWLHKLFILAGVKKSPGIVLFSDANLLDPPSQTHSLLYGERDGFQEIRQLFVQLAKNYRGRILLIHSPAEDTPFRMIQWRNNIGTAAGYTPWMSVHVNLKSTALFTLETRHEPPPIPNDIP